MSADSLRPDLPAPSPISPFPTFDAPAFNVQTPAALEPSPSRPEIRDYATAGALSSADQTANVGGDGSNRPTQSRRRLSTASTTSMSTISTRVRSASQKFGDSSLPLGMWHAAGSLASSIPTMKDIRRESYGAEAALSNAGTEPGDERPPLNGRALGSRGSVGSLSTRRSSNPKLLTEPRYPSIAEDADPEHAQAAARAAKGGATAADSEETTGEDKAKDDPRWRTEPFDNGYRFPPPKRWTEATVVGCKALWRYFLTPLGFCVIVYFLNVVAWGGMLFLLLCNAAPAMCHPSCNDLYSPRKIWLEIDSQILCGLFCVTAFGLLPWRGRDFYYLMQYRCQKNEVAWRRLAGIHRGWFRLEGSQDLATDIGPDNIETRAAELPESSIPFPLKSIPDAPLTGNRAPATAPWKMDFVIHMMIWNTLIQVILCGFMWGINRFKRSSFATGILIGVGCVVAMVAGILMFIEGNHIKAIEGVPVNEKDMEKINRDLEKGLTVYNNIKGKPPKEKKSKEEKKAEKRALKEEKKAAKNKKEEKNAVVH